MNKDVILVFPGKEESYNPVMPLSLLYLASLLEKNGYNPRIVDARIEDYKKIKTDNAICVCITAMTSQIKYGLEIAKYVRETNPNVPIIWGGVHASMLPTQTIKNEYVDIVVRGEGELTLLELVEKLESGKPISDVKGIAYKAGEKIKSTPDREFMDLNTISIDLPYHLLKLERYPHFQKEKNFPIQTSRGCPHRCTFCHNLSYNKRSYRMKSADRILDEIEYVVNTFDIKKMWLTFDDNLFVYKKRVEGIASGLINRGIDIKWETFCRFDYFARVDQSFIKLLERSGCDLISFGGESGSPRILKLIKKDITIDQILSASKKLSKSNITQTTSFMCGFPTETKEELNMTFRLIDKIVKVNPKATIVGIFPYTPYPGTELYDDIIRDFGFKPPSTLEGWSNYEIYGGVATWFDKSYRKLLETISVMSRFPFYTDNYEIPEQHADYKHIYKLYSFFARTRWKHRFFGFPVEWNFFKYMMKNRRGFM